VQASFQFDSHRLNFRAHRIGAFVCRNTVNHPFSVFPLMCVEAQKVEALRFPVAASRRFLSAWRPKFDEPCLVGMQVQAKLRESFADFREDRSASCRCSNPTTKFIGKTHNDHVTLRLRLSPLLSQSRVRSADRCLARSGEMLPPGQFLLHCVLASRPQALQRPNHF